MHNDVRKIYSPLAGRNQIFRDNIAKEILSTEVVYVTKLKALQDIWVKPLTEGGMAAPCFNSQRAPKRGF